MFIYARSAQCNSGPIYTLTNTQHIRIYPGKSWSKFNLIQDVNMANIPRKQTLFMFLATENLSGLPCSHECKYGVYSDLSSYAVNLPEKMHLHRDING